VFDEVLEDDDTSLGHLVFGRPGLRFVTLMGVSLTDKVGEALEEVVGDRSAAEWAKEEK